MTKKLRIVLSQRTAHRLKGYVLLHGYDLEGVVNDAFYEWCERNRENLPLNHENLPMKRITAAVPVDINFLKDVKKFTKINGTTLVRAVEEALTGYLDRQTGAAKASESLPILEAPTTGSGMPKTETVEKRSCLCGRCGHIWTPKGKSSPSYCPKCTSREWDKVIWCDNVAAGSCDRRAAVANTDAGAATMCEPCYRDMKCEG